MDGEGHWSVRLAADPGGVPGARRFVVEGLTAWGLRPLVESAALVASELAANAALHGGAEFMYVSLTALPGGGVRVAVEDDGQVTPVAVHPPAPEPGVGNGIGRWPLRSTTGRGLALVSVLSKDWGVVPTDRGKQVWADVVDPDVEQPVRPPARAAGEAGAAVGGRLPPGWVLVRLAACPVELSIRQDQHLDELVRELQLMVSGNGSTHSREIAAQIEMLLVSPAHARVTGRRTAERARAEGLRSVDIDLAMPAEFSSLVQQLDDAVRRADELCRHDELLALPSPPELRELRAWMTHEIVAQIERAESPTPWSAWRTAAHAGDGSR